MKRRAPPAVTPPTGTPSYPARSTHLKSSATPPDERNETVRARCLRDIPLKGCAHVRTTDSMTAAEGKLGAAATSGTRVARYRTRAITAAGARGNLRNMADLPSLGVYWISNLGMTHRRTNPTSPARRGFTLIEAAIVTAIVGIGIVGLLELLAAGSMANIQSKQLTTAVFLANNVNEMMQGHEYATLKSTYDNKTYQPPKDGRGVTLSGFDNWAQIVDVSYVETNRLTHVVPDTQVTDTCRVTVKIMTNNEVIYQTQWIVAAPE